MFRGHAGGPVPRLPTRGQASLSPTPSEVVNTGARVRVAVVALATYAVGGAVVLWATPRVDTTSGLLRYGVAALVLGFPWLTVTFAARPPTTSTELPSRRSPITPRQLAVLVGAAFGGGVFLVPAVAAIVAFDLSPSLDGWAALSTLGASCAGTVLAYEVGPSRD